jgi:peroxiredoxin
MKNFIIILLLLSTVQFSFAQKTVYLDSLNHNISESEFQKLSEPIKDYVINETSVVNGETITTHRIPDHKTLTMIYSEIAKYNNVVKAKVGTPFPVTEMHTLDGSSFNIKAYSNRIVVMNFWFVGCAPCIEEMPALNKLVKEFSNNTDVVFIAPSLSTKQQLEEFIKKREFNYKLTHNASDLLQKELNVISYPTQMIVDKKGIISFVETNQQGEKVTQILSSKINELLKIQK